MGITTGYVIVLGHIIILPRVAELDIKLRELEESVKCRRERRKEQKKVMEQELEHNLKSLKKESQSQDRSVVNESEKQQLRPVSAGGSGNNSGNASGNMANIGNLVSDQEEKYIRELCETEKRIRQLESVISDLNFELEKIDLAETTGSVGVTVKTGAEISRVSTDI